jgi:hypothetical protein
VGAVIEKRMTPSPPLCVCSGVAFETRHRASSTISMTMA